MFNRKMHWQNIYHEKSALDVSWHQEIPELSLALIRNARLESNDAIIDVGGGASVLVDCLIKEGRTDLAVLDISKNALDSAKKRLGDDEKKVEWYEADVTQFDSPHSFSLWHDRAVFHFLTQAIDRQSYMKSLQRALKPKGHLIISAFSIGGPKKCSGLDIVQYDANKLKAELGNGFKLLEEKNEIHITPNHKEQKFTYFRFVRN